MASDYYEKINGRWVVEHEDNTVKESSLFNKIGKEFVVMNFRIFPEHKSTLQGQWSRRCVDSGFT